MAETSTYGADELSDRLFIEDPDAAEAAREVKAWLAAGEISKALITCNRMLSLRPDDRLFEGLRLEGENRAREIRVEFIRQLGVELERVPDLDARVESIRQARLRYPSETSLSDLLENATARRNLIHTLIAEARNEEHSEGYARALERWHLVQELFPMMPGLDEEIRRVESLAETQKKMKRRSEFVDAIFQLSSTGEYSRALYQCINALAEYPNDGGLLTLRKSIEEKAEHATELQKFVAHGLTFLQAHEVEAALECFGRAKAIDQNNLQVRYLIGIALLEKARLVMDADRRKLNLLLDEARSFMPNQPELQSLSFESDAMSVNSEKALVRIELPAAKPQQDAEQPAIAEATNPVPPEESSPVPQPQSSLRVEPAPTRKSGSLQKAAVLGLVIFGALAIGWVIYVNQSAVEKPAAVPPAQRVDIKTTPAGAEIFIDGRKVGESQAQVQLTSGNHTVSASLAGYESRTLSLDLASEPKALEIELQPILMDVHVSTDQPESVVWMDEQPKGDVTDKGITISGVEPGVRVITIQRPGSEVEFSFDFRPGKMPTPVSFPPRQIVNVLFAGSTDGKLRVECNCAPAGLRVGDIAEMIRAGGLELPLEGQRAAELWMGKSRRNLTIHGSLSPVATIALFSNPGADPSHVEPGR